MTVRSQSPQDTNETIKYWRGLKVRKEPKKKQLLTKQSNNGEIKRARDTNETIK